jgi:hypothetical protein
MDLFTLSTPICSTIGKRFRDRSLGEEGVLTQLRRLNPPLIIYLSGNPRRDGPRLPTSPMQGDGAVRGAFREMSLPRSHRQASGSWTYSEVKKAVMKGVAGEAFVSRHPPPHVGQVAEQALEPGARPAKAGGNSSARPGSESNGGGPLATKGVLCVRPDAQRVPCDPGPG